MTDTTIAPVVLAPTGLVLSPGMKPVDIKNAIQQAVADLVPVDKHVVAVGVLTPSGLRFVAGQRIGSHVVMFENVTYAHSNGRPWSGEVGIVGTW